MKKKKEKQIKLGLLYEDPITGCMGIAIAKTEWLYGCSRIGLQGRINEEGLVPEAQWFDELQLNGIKTDKDLGGPPCQGKETG